MKQAAVAVMGVLPHGQHKVLANQTHDVKAAALAPVLLTFFKESD